MKFIKNLILILCLVVASAKAMQKNYVQSEKIQEAEQGLRQLQAEAAKIKKLISDQEELIRILKTGTPTIALAGLQFIKECEEKFKRKNIKYAEAAKEFISNNLGLINSENEQLETPLSIAAGHANQEIVQFLLEKGAKVTLAAVGRAIGLLNVNELRAQQIIKDLLESDVDLDGEFVYKGASKDTVLTALLKEYDRQEDSHSFTATMVCKLAQDFVKHGADINGKAIPWNSTDRRMTPLEYAINNRLGEEIVMCLKALGAHE